MVILSYRFNRKGLPLQIQYTFYLILIPSDDTWQVFYNGIRDYDNLSDSDKARFNFLIGMYFGIQDTVMVHENLGVWKNNETYQRILEESYRMFRMPGVQSWWRQHSGRVFAPRVEAYLLERARAEDKAYTD